MTKPVAPALEGWFTLDAEKPHLIGTQCKSCGTYYFPKQSVFCKNPDCNGEAFDEVQLSRTGKVWSFTNACMSLRIRSCLTRSSQSSWKRKR